MQAENNIAFKEWAVICAALAEGRQTLILRKGGIDEGAAGFRVQYSEFWLFPTYLHASEGAGRVIPEATADLARVEAERPAGDAIRLREYVQVSDVQHLDQWEQVLRLAGKHLWSPETVAQRFQYRTPGLFVLTVRVFRLPEPSIIPAAPHFAGCRSWVELPRALATTGLAPVLTDAEFEHERQTVQELLA